MPHDVKQNRLIERYRETAEDEAREREAQEWIEGVIDCFGDVESSGERSDDDKSAA